MHRVLMIASPLGDTANFTALARALADMGCLCVIADLPGYGKSECGAQAKQDNDTRARILWGILDEIDEETGGGLASWHLIGHGSGCAAVMMMALTQPESVLSKVLISPLIDYLLPPPFGYLLSTRFGGWALRSWYGRTILNKKRFRHFVTRLYGARLTRDRLRDLQKPLAREGFISTLSATLKHGYAVPDAAYQGFEPVVLFWGGRDPYFGGQIPSRLLKKFAPKQNKKDTGKKRAKKRNGASGIETHVIRGAAHYAMETHADIVGDYLRGWIRYVEGGQ